METGRYIKITENKKVINPAHEAPLFSYVGSIEDYNFARQKKNYDNIQNILEPYNKKLTHIYVGSFMGHRRPKTVFLAHNEDKSLWWRKYECSAEGSGQNMIYFRNGFMIKTTEFLNNYANWIHILLNE